MEKTKLIEQINLLLHDSEVSLSYVEHSKNTENKESNELYIKHLNYNKGQIDTCRYLLKIIEKID